MLDALRAAPVERMELSDYLEEFFQNFWEITGPGFWKLERQQTFKEPGEPSWIAFDSGDWNESLRLIEKKRTEYGDYFGRVDARGFANRRVRIVEKPVTPYLQWELHVLVLRHAFGGLTNVLDVADVAEHEEAGPLPEIYTLGTEVMYEAVYDETGVLAAANKWTDPALIAEWQRFIERLYRRGEPLDAYFAREIAPLPPPTGP